MSDNKKLALAKTVYKTLCKALDNREWKYDKEEGKLLVHFSVSGDDIPMKFIIVVDDERQLIRVMSPMSFNIAEDKRMEGAIATCMVNYKLSDGSFDYDIADGRIVYRMTASFRESVIGEGLIQYLIGFSCTVVDEYNDKFLALSKGLVGIDDFIKSLS